MDRSPRSKDDTAIVEDPAKEIEVNIMDPGSKDYVESIKDSTHGKGSLDVDYLSSDVSNISLESAKESHHVLTQKGSVDGYDSQTDNKLTKDSDDVDDFESSDDLSDDYDSDANQNPRKMRIKNKWLRVFFETMDSLTVEEINKQTRRWHCPACHDGPGAINWFKGMHPLISHARTKRSTRIDLHRKFAKLLDEEIRRRGISVRPDTNAFGDWESLYDLKTDHEIVWPPMVAIMNTIFKKDDDKWLGLGKQELLEYFSEYAAIRAHGSYGPDGHRGMSILIFESSPMGYSEAARLHKHFVTIGRDRDAWEIFPMKFCPGEERHLYGYLALEEDLDIFNQHFEGKSKLKFKMRSYQKMVAVPMKQMSEGNRLVSWLKKKLASQDQRLKVIEENQRLHEKMQEVWMGSSTKIQNDEYKEAMGSHLQFPKEQFGRVHNSPKDHSNREQIEREAKPDRPLESWVEERDEYLREERERLLNAHEVKKAELKRRHLVEELELQQELKTALENLVDDVTC